MRTLDKLACAGLALLLNTAPGTMASPGEPSSGPSDAERARWTMSDMRSWAMALEEYRIDNGTFPVDTALSAVRDRIQPAYSAPPR